tara:strand:+ start:4754 stop:5038 length:285 start_codon:yes stop_codon:yes gene_type:complete
MDLFNEINELDDNFKKNASIIFKRIVSDILDKRKLKMQQDFDNILSTMNYNAIEEELKLKKSRLKGKKPKEIVKNSKELLPESKKENKHFMFRL